MKIIFLDVDGVMNSELYYRSVNRKKKNWRRFDPIAIKMIKRLVKEFDAKIVISSLWRMVAKEELRIELKESGLINYLHQDWKTPEIQPGNRGLEIKKWLKHHPEVEGYVVLDDDEDVIKEKLPNVIKTELFDGMMPEHYFKAREILEKGIVE